MSESKINDVRRFTFDQREFIIVDIIKEPNISMEQNWGKFQCPHCKKDIDKIKTHIFNIIEIMVPKNMLDNKDSKPMLLFNAIMLGIDKDGRKLLINKEKRNEVLKLSTFFKEVI